jgi:hypothetical protein
MANYASLRNANAYSYWNCHSHSYANADTDADGSRYGDTYAYLHTRSGVGDCCASAYCALWKQRSFRWYVLLFNRRL